MAEALFSEADILALLRRYNPWWEGRPASRLPHRERAAVSRLLPQVQRRASLPLLLYGARGTGKTVVLLHIAMRLLREGAPPEYVLYVPFRHPLFQRTGIEGVVGAWSRATPRKDSPLFLLFDDLPHAAGWPPWLERHAGMQQAVRVLATAAVRTEEPQGWLEERLPPLSFREFLHLRGIGCPEIPEQQPLRDLLAWEPADFQQTSMVAHGLAGHFNEYLRRGGWPAAILADSAEAAAEYLREQVAARALREDLPALCGVRRITEVESLFLYLCRNGCPLVELQELSGRLDISKNTLRKHLQLIERARLVNSLRPFGYGKEVRRGRMRIMPADASLAWAMLLRGADLFEDAQTLHDAVEACVYRHVLCRPAGNPEFSYWRGPNDDLVSFVATGSRGQSRAFLVSYTDAPERPQDLAGLRRFCADKGVDLAYVVTKKLDDFGLSSLPAPGRGPQEDLATRILRIPAALFAYWMS